MDSQGWTVPSKYLLLLSCIFLQGAEAGHGLTVWFPWEKGTSVFSLVCPTPTRCLPVCGYLLGTTSPHSFSTHLPLTSRSTSSLHSAPSAYQVNAQQDYLEILYSGKYFAVVTMWIIYSTVGEWHVKTLGRHFAKGVYPLLCSGNVKTN